MRNSNNTIIKSKDNRRESTINRVAEASIKNMTLEKAETLLVKAEGKMQSATKEKAKAFFAIKSKELYKPEHDDFRSYMESAKDGVRWGVQYNQANNLANMWAYVWCDESLREYDSNKANVLVAYIKKDYSKVRSLHDKGKISPSMKKEDITNALKAEFGDIQKDGRAAKRTAKATVEKDYNINADINIIEKVVQAYITACTKEEIKTKVNEAWENILNELCQ